MSPIVRAAVIVAGPTLWQSWLATLRTTTKPKSPSAHWDAKDWLPHSGATICWQYSLGIWATPTPTTPPSDSRHGITGGRLYNSEGWPLGVSPGLTPATPNWEHGITGQGLYPGMLPIPTIPPATPALPENLHRGLRVARPL